MRHAPRNLANGSRELMMVRKFEWSCESCEELQKNLLT
jgi:hypothetical protein